tara:strand:+ start:841 stop:1656 length:816 start_codon:yes stop_codon:yes gene_type:complete
MSKNIFNEAGTIVSNNMIASNTYEATIKCQKISKYILPGQFINILPNKKWTGVMRRPMSVASSNENLISIIYKVVGPGTDIMSKWKKNDKIDIIGPLGNHWSNFDKTPIIIGGGVGIAPILFLHNYLNKKSIDHHMIMGARNSQEHFLKHNNQGNFLNILTTDDGSLGIKGNVIDGLKYIEKDISKLKKYKIFVCGPPVMMESVKFLCDKNNIICDVALETIMACGFGVCQGCTVEFDYKDSKKHSYRNKYGLVCCDGPIFNSKDIKTCLI